MSKKIEYPKFVFHKTQGHKIVQTKEEHEALGKGWEETPAAFNKKQDEKEPQPTASAPEGSDSGSGTEAGETTTEGSEGEDLDQDSNHGSDDESDDESDDGLSEEIKAEDLMKKTNPVLIEMLVAKGFEASKLKGKKKDMTMANLTD